MSTVKRKPNWQSLLVKFVNENRKKPFTWGAWDCCSFTAQAIDTMTGTDLGADFAGYTDEASAFAKIKAVTGGSGVSDVITYVVNKYGLTAVKSPAFAQRGDLVLVNNNGTQIAGIIGLDGKCQCVTDNGLVSFPITAAAAAYRI